MHHFAFYGGQAKEVAMAITSDLTILSAGNTTVKVKLKWGDKSEFYPLLCLCVASNHTNPKEKQNLFSRLLILFFFLSFLPFLYFSSPKAITSHNISP